MSKGKADIDTKGNKGKPQRRTTSLSANLAPAKSGPKLTKACTKYRKEKANPGKDGSDLPKLADAETRG